MKLIRVFLFLFGASLGGVIAKNFMPSQSISYYIPDVSYKSSRLSHFKIIEKKPHTLDACSKKNEAGANIGNCSLINLAETF